MEWLSNFASWVVNTGFDETMWAILAKNKYTMAVVIHLGVGFSALTSWKWDDKIWKVLSGPFAPLLAVIKKAISSN